MFLARVLRSQNFVPSPQTCNAFALALMDPEAWQIRLRLILHKELHGPFDNCFP